jgi:hypothetical protein
MQHRSIYPCVHPINARLRDECEMRIAKPMLLIATPVGVIGGVYEAFRLAGGLAFLMIALIAMIGAAIGMLVMTIVREQRVAARAPIATGESGKTCTGEHEERRQ